MGDALDSQKGIRAVAGLVAVVVGISAVTGLAVFTLTRFGSSDKTSIVAVTTSAFGIISTVVGAYLGIKTAGSASDSAKEAAVAKHVARSNEKEVANLQAAMKDSLPKADRKRVLAAAAQIEAEGQ